MHKNQRVNKEKTNRDDNCLGATVKLSDRDAFAERIKVLINEAGSIRSLAKLCGASESIIRKWAKGESDPSRLHLVGLSISTGVSLQWLATGEGPMRPGEKQGETDDEFALVPLYDVEVSAGHGAQIDQEQVKAQIAFRRDWLAQNGFNFNSLVSLTARGDSMEPTLKDGDLLLVDTSQKDVVEDGIYVLRLNNHLLAKRLQRLTDGTIIIKSDNPAYESETVPKDAAEALHVIGRVVWTGRKI